MRWQPRGHPPKQVALGNPWSVTHSLIVRSKVRVNMPSNVLSKHKSVQATLEGGHVCPGALCSAPFQNLLRLEPVSSISVVSSHSLSSGTSAAVATCSCTGRHSRLLGLYCLDSSRREAWSILCHVSADPQRKGSWTRGQGFLACDK